MADTATLTLSREDMLRLGEYLGSKLIEAESDPYMPIEGSPEYKRERGADLVARAKAVRAAWTEIQGMELWEDVSDNSEEPAMNEAPATLDALLAAMRADDPSLGDWASLPIYGPELDNPERVWSWDESRAIVGRSSDDVRIVPYRAENGRLVVDLGA